MKIKSTSLALLAIVILATASFGQDATKRKKKPPAYDKSVPKPTESEVRYGDHKRNVLDFWKASSEQPTPLVFIIHSGGWTSGSKEAAHRFVDVAKLLKAGISVVAINYRYTTQAGDIEPPVKAPLYDSARALQFVRSQAADWNIDKKRIGAAGGSAGACTSLWLCFHDDLADSSSDDPIARESTRFLCAAIHGAQTTLDPQQMKQWTPNSKYGGHAFGKANFKKFLAARESILPWIKEYSPYELVSKDDPPVFLNYWAKPAVGKPAKDPTHTANFGAKLKERCESVGTTCHVFYPGVENAQWKTPTEFLIAKLQTGQ